MVFTVSNGTYPALLEGHGSQYFHIPYEYAFVIGPEKWIGQSDQAQIIVHWLMHSYWSLTIPIAITYAIVIHVIQWLMKDRPAFELKWPLILWNTAHAAFSVVGLLRVSEEFLYVLWNLPLADSISYCTHPFQPATLWAGLFAVAKIAELGDTIFVVLRKKPLIFLHWYHHAVVLVFAWHSLKEGAAGGRWYVFMNYGVHSLMYTYYALTAAGFRFPRMLAMGLTSMQTTQMFIGVAISFIAFYFKLQGKLVNQSFENLFFGFSIYLSFAILFSDYFTKSYFTDKKKKTKIQ